MLDTTLNEQYTEHRLGRKKILRQDDTTFLLMQLHRHTVNKHFKRSQSSYHNLLTPIH